MKNECVDFGRVADRIYLNAKTSTTLSANGGVWEQKPVCTYSLDIYNISINEKAKTLQSCGGGQGVNEGCVVLQKKRTPND